MTDRFSGVLFQAVLGAVLGVTLCLALLVLGFGRDSPGLFILACSALGALVFTFRWLLKSERHLEILMNALKQEKIDLSECEAIDNWSDLATRIRRILREADNKLHAEKTKLTDFLAAIQASPIGVMLLDENNQIEWSNRTAGAMLGLNPDTDRFQNLQNLVRHPELVDYLTKKEFSKSIDLLIVHPGSNRNSRIKIQLHLYDLGKKLLLAQDVTDIELAENQRRDFVANASHELGTPLSIISASVETLANPSLAPAQSDLLIESIKSQSTRMQNLITDLMTLAKLEGSPMPSVHTEVDFETLVYTAIGDGKSWLATRRKAISIYADIEPAVVLGKLSELRSAVSNLINNALQYAEFDGRVDVKVAITPNNELRFSVKDDGPGIPPEHLARLTERFYRVDQSRSSANGGTGLGLSIVKHVVSRHGGYMQIDSTVSEGSDFGFVLPATRVLPRN